MTLSLEQKWVWDSWYAHDGKQWHAYFLQADKSLGDPDLRHWNASQGHAVSDDLKNWTQLGTCFEPAQSPAWDDYTTWTGSVVQDGQQLWHLFYTGTSHAENGLYQRIGHAVSTDMHHWERVDSGLCLDLSGAQAQHYEAEHQSAHWHDRAMRDPWVMPDPEADGWLMFFTARVPGVAEANAGGAIGFARSADLYHWQLQAPVFAGAYGQLEVPQVFSIDGRWFCLFCTAAEHWARATAEARGETPVTGNHYLIADQPEGPWRLPDAPFLDGALPAYRYAARVLHTRSGHRLIGFHDNGREQFAGVILDPVAITLDADNLLQLNHSR